MKPGNDETPSLTAFHSDGRRELGRSDRERDTDNKPFFPHAR